MIFLTCVILLFFFYVTVRATLLDTEICMGKRGIFVALFFSHQREQLDNDDNLAYLKCLNDHIKLNHTWPEFW